MDKKEEEFYRRLLATYKVEAEEHIKNLTSGLIELEKSPPEKRTGLLEDIFRETHSLKGASRSVNLSEVERIGHNLENIFSEMKKGALQSSQDLCNLLHNAIDRASELAMSAPYKLSKEEMTDINKLVQQLESASKGYEIKIEKTISELIPETQKELKPILEKTQETFEEIKYKEPIEEVSTEDFVIEKEETDEGQIIAAHAKLPQSGFVRISDIKLNKLLLQIEELQSAKLSFAQYSSDISGISSYLDTWNNEKIKNHTEFFKNLHCKINSLDRSMSELNLSYGIMVDNIMEDLKKVQLFPFSSLLEGFPKLIRDISVSLGKKIEWIVNGSEIEIDKRILEEIKDPLIHIIRNSVHHGIEKPEERESKNKSPNGKILFEILQLDAGTIEITISDDGAGINMDKLKKTLVNMDLIKSEQIGTLTEQELLPYIFKSGVSTASYVSNISGRGLGLAIVKEKVEKINGDVTIETSYDKGAKFKIILPVNLATFRGVIVREKGQSFVFPSTYVEQAIRIGKDDIKSAENRETLQYKGKAVSLVRLGDVLGLPRDKELNPADKFPVIIINSLQKKIAFLVDDVLREQEILVKNLGKFLPHVRNIAAGTILSDGKAILILNVPDLLRSAISHSSSQTGLITEAFESGSDKKNRVLVVEDSITSRTLLKNIIETAGYNVSVAVDGVDALKKLKSEEFDLVVSDIDMPRMNGFVLTENIRSDGKLSETPVVLVTSLDSRDDKERGLEVGANAYIVKGNFDQYHLIDVIKRLI